MSRKKRCKKKENDVFYLLKIGKRCVIITLPKNVNISLCNSSDKVILRLGNSNIRKRNPTLMNTAMKYTPRAIIKSTHLQETVNIKDAANFIIGLFYNNKRICKSAVVQKLLVIAQMKCLKQLGKPLFSDDIVVKPLCFSIEFISKMYPIVIFDDDNWSKELTEITLQEFTAQILNDDCPYVQDVSYFYEIVGNIPDCFIEILKETYRRFGGYSGSVLGKCMREMALHKDSVPGTRISVSQLRKHVCNLISTGKYDAQIVDYINSEQ